MAEEITVARPYAEAVFALARESNALPVWGEMLRSAADVKQAQAAGLVSVHRTTLVVNCPIVP